MIHTITYDEDEEFTSIPYGVGVFPPLRYAITGLFRVFPPLRYAITALFRVFPPLRYAITGLFRVSTPLRYPLKLTSNLHSHCHESSNRFQTIPNDFNVQLPMMKTKSSKGFQYVPNSVRASSILLGCPVSLVVFHFLHVSGEEVTSELHSHCHESSNRFQTTPNDSKRSSDVQQFIST